MSISTAATTACTPYETEQVPACRAAASLEGATFERICRRMVLDSCKWDPQVGDVYTLVPFPLIIQRTTWQQLARWAEALTLELLSAEAEVLACAKLPEFLRRLALPRSLRRLFLRRAPADLAEAGGRVMRFDFHLTIDGWRISEVNSDVPGGYSESSDFPALMAEHYPFASPPGSPAAAWAAAIERAAFAGPSPEGPVALLSATGFMEDHEVVAYLARKLQGLGRRAFLASPAQIRWRDGVAHLDGDCYVGPLSAVVRFYQAEWLAGLPRRLGWCHYFRGGRTPVRNPGVAVLAESKRFPLLWDKLTTAMPTWRRLLPETRDPRDAPWREEPEVWVLKSAFCNTGDTVAARSVLGDAQWRQASREVLRRPGEWVAQRRFQLIPVDTPLGPRFACLGVYTVDGTAAGVYGRVSVSPVINYQAADVAVLVE